MAVTQERTPTPREPVCAICHMPIRAEQDRVTVQEAHYHGRCYERREARGPRAAASKEVSAVGWIKKGEPPMSLFGSILEKLGLKTKTEPAPPGRPAGPGTPPPAATQATTPAPAAPPRPTAISVVDVVAKLEGLAARNPQKLNWKVSIVDLLKLLDINSSYEARKELATELGCPAELMGDSAKMNMWLHKTVLNKIAENGGNIPKELLD
jgi:hypothetical protein